MPDDTPRKPGRPRTGETVTPMTAAARAKASRERHGNKAVMLPGDVIAVIDVIAARDGDGSRVAAITRLVREAG